MQHEENTPQKSDSQELEFRGKGTEREASKNVP